MHRYLKALIATGLTVVPVAIKQYAPTPWDMVAILAYAGVVFLASAHTFKPDRRFQLVREPTLDAAFITTFSEDFEHDGEPEVETPFRVHVFTPEGIGPRRKLCVAYAYNSNPAHADHGRSWPRGHGLVWKSFSSGVPEFSIQGDENWRSCGLDEAENKATSHVHAVFTIPLRRPAESEKEKVSSKVTAVLSFDALTQQAAQTLKQQYEQFLENKNKKLLQRAAWISLYF